MTTKDQTGDRLVASVRRTRAGAEQTTGKQAAAKGAPRRTATTGKATTPAQGAVTRTDSALSRDSYQSGDRVWPD
jgi:hypothetical protein